MDRRYAPSELSGLKPARLQEVATAAGIKKPFHKNLNASARRERILRHYAKLDAALAEVRPDPNEPRIMVPVNSAFEAKCDTSGPVVSIGGDAPQTSTAPQAPDGRGGARPGAGRPLGMTAERARMTHVTDIPHRLYTAGFRMLFAAWAEWVGTDKVELTEQEAIDIALPWSQLGEYLGWNDHVPEWADIILCGLWTTYNTFKSKSKIAREFTKNQGQNATGGPREKNENSHGDLHA
jgi:hypothetical protein